MMILKPGFLTLLTTNNAVELNQIFYCSVHGLLVCDETHLKNNVFNTLVEYKSTTPMHLYLRSYEKIKVGEPYLSADGRIVFWTQELEDAYGENVNDTNPKAIVATTNKKASVPNFSLEFLQEYCKKGNLKEKNEDVFIEYKEIPWKEHELMQLPDYPFAEPEKRSVVKIFSGNTVNLKFKKIKWDRHEHIADIKRIIQLYTTTYESGDIDKWIENVVDNGY